MCLEKEDREMCERQATKCVFIPGDDADCSLPTTTLPPMGCCYGDSYKANGKCQMAFEQDKCEDKGCNWLETDDPTDCIITTTTTPTPDTTEEEVGCCKGEDFKANQKCNTKLDRKSCERGGKCTFIVDGSLEKECRVEEEKEPGCCYGDTAKTNEMCLAKEDKEMCERQATKCVFIPGDDADCSLPTTTLPPLGCCKGEDFGSNQKCNTRLDRKSCERGGKCTFIV